MLNAVFVHAKGLLLTTEVGDNSPSGFSDTQASP